MNEESEEISYKARSNRIMENNELFRSKTFVTFTAQDQRKQRWQKLDEIVSCFL